MTHPYGPHTVDPVYPPITMHKAPPKKGHPRITYTVTVSPKVIKLIRAMNAIAHEQAQQRTGRPA